MQNGKSWPLSLAKTRAVLTFTPLTMLQVSAQAVDFKVGRHFGEGQPFKPVPFAKTKNAFEMIGMRSACNIVTRTKFHGVAEFWRTTGIT